MATDDGICENVCHELDESSIRQNWPDDDLQAWW